MELILGTAAGQENWLFWMPITRSYGSAGLRAENAAPGRAVRTRRLSGQATCDLAGQMMTAQPRGFDPAAAKAVATQAQAKVGVPGGRVVLR